MARLASCRRFSSNSRMLATPTASQNVAKSSSSRWWILVLSLAIFLARVSICFLSCSKVGTLRASSLSTILSSFSTSFMRSSVNFCKGRPRHSRVVRKKTHDGRQPHLIRTRSVLR